MPITDLEATDLLAARFGRAGTAPDTWIVALAFAAPDNSGAGGFYTVGSGYQPVEVPNDTGHWAPLPGGRGVTNTQPITFPIATQDGWDNASYYVLRDPDGNVRAWGSIDPPLPVPAGAQPSFAPGSIVISSPAAS